MKAIDAFLAQIAEMEALGKKLESLADRFPDKPEEIHWGHVGDLAYINERVRETLAHFYTEDTDELQTR
jgi:hypothetical protein